MNKKCLLTLLLFSTGACYAANVDIDPCNITVEKKTYQGNSFVSVTVSQAGTMGSTEFPVNLQMPNQDGVQGFLQQVVDNYQVPIYAQAAIRIYLAGAKSAVNLTLKKGVTKVE